MPMINADSFVATNERKGTVEVTLGDVTRRVPAVRSALGGIIAFGIVGRYSNDPTIYIGSLTQRDDGQEYFFFECEPRGSKNDKDLRIFFTD